MHILNIAEKPSIAKSISSLLNPNYKSTKSNFKYCPFYKFPYKIHQTEVQFTFTAVLGHLYTYGLSGTITNTRIHTRLNNSLKEPNRIDCWKTENPIDMYDYPVTFTPNQPDLINNLTKKADIIIIWTDNDREGEHIAREIADTIGPHYGITKKYGIVKSDEYDLKKVNYRNQQSLIFSLEEVLRKNLFKIYRAKFSEVSGNAINTALSNLTLINFDEVNAVDTRIQMDLRTGFCLTRILTENLLTLANIPNTPEDINKNILNIVNKENIKNIQILSYGNCQIPTLGFVVERFLQVVNFKPEDFFSLQIDLPCFYTKDCCKQTVSKTLTLKWTRNLFEKNAMISFYEKLLCQTPSIEITKTETTVNKPSGLNTTKLISLCSSLLKIPSDETMKIAENLYTKGFISYPRTETNSYPLNFDFKKVLKNFKHQTFRRKFCCTEKEIPLKFYSPPVGNRNDQAHLPIYPIRPFNNNISNNNKELRVFNLILEQFAASLHENGIDSVTKITVSFPNSFTDLNILPNPNISVKDKCREIFKGEYRKAKKLGFREILSPNCETRDLSIPKIAPQKLNQSLKQISDTTKPPKLLTETNLINLMDKHEIGTDATIHEHIKKILERKYVFKGNGLLVPSFVGVALINSFRELKELYKPSFSAEFERNLKRIANSESEKGDVLSEEIFRYKRITELILRDIEGYKREFKETYEKYKEYLKKLNFTSPLPPSTGDSSIPIIDIRDIRDKSLKGDKSIKINKENEESPLILIETSTFKKDLLDSKEIPLKKIKSLGSNKQLEVENSVKYKPFNDQQCDCGFDTKRVISKTSQNFFRIFLVCKKEYKKCKYFKWED